MTGIIFTLSEEATAVANEYTDGRVDPIDEDHSVQVGDLLMMATGSGKINAALATERLLHRHDNLDVLLHTGTCTPLSENLAPGTLVGASSVLEGDRVALDDPAYPQMPLSLPFDTPAEGVLVSQDHPPQGGDERGYWARLADVRDETGYAVAYVAAQHGVPCHVAKVVGDALDAVDEPAVQDTVTPFLRRIADTLQPRS